LRNSVISRTSLTIIIALNICLLSGQIETTIQNEADSLYLDGYIIDKAFLQELRDVIDYDSTDFLTYELNFYNEILTNEPRLDELRLQADHYLNEYSIYSKRSDFKSALESYKKYLVYKDSINTVLNARNVTDLNEQFKTLEKQKNIEMLNRENQLKTLGLEKRKQIRWIMYIALGSLFFLLMTFLIFVRVKILKKGKLNLEAAARRNAEKALLKTKVELENLVEERKTELKRTNKLLKTEIVEIEEIHQRIFRAERLKIVGEMSGGMIKVIEQPVCSITIAAQSFKDTFTNGEKEINELADILTHTSSKVNNTLQSIRQFSLAERSNLKPTSVNEIIRNTINLFKFRELNKKIEFCTSLSSRLPLLNLDKVKVEGIIMNLILNSIDSISEEGSITISTRNLRDNVIIAFTDSGSGIDKKDLKEIFNPFFTTKEKGFGLGLSIVHQYVLSMQGKIDFSSQLGKGTRVRISFPFRDNDEQF
jgi:signal transduction histidine kinase